MNAWQLATMAGRPKATGGFIRPGFSPGPWLDGSFVLPRRQPAPSERGPEVFIKISNIAPLILEAPRRFYK